MTQFLSVENRSMLKSITRNQEKRQGMALWIIVINSVLDMLSMRLGHPDKGVQEVAGNRDQELTGDIGDENGNMN